MTALCLGSFSPAYAVGVTPRPDIGASGSAAEFRATDLTVLRDQLQSWLVQTFRSEGVVVRGEVLGEWGLSTSVLPDVAVRANRKRLASGSWQLDLTLCPAVDQLCQAASRALIRFRVRELAEVWVVAGELKKGDALVCGALRREWRDARARGVEANWQEACEALAGWRARHPLQPGDVLKSTDLMPQDGVMEKDVAQVFTRLGNIEIQAKGMVLADARVGQQVPVRLTGQTNVVQCVVIAPGVVRVMEGL